MFKNKKRFKEIDGEKNLCKKDMERAMFHNMGMNQPFRFLTIFDRLTELERKLDLLTKH